MARGWLSWLGMGNSVTAPSTVMRPMRLPAASENHSAPSRTAIDSGFAPGEMPSPYSVMRPSGVIFATRLASLSENQILPSGPRIMPSAPAFGVGSANSADVAARRDAADLVGGLLGEPQIAVAAGGDADRRRILSRQRELRERAAVRIEAADLGRAAFAEPQRAVRPLDRDIGLGAGARNPMLADRYFIWLHMSDLTALRCDVRRPPASRRAACAAFMRSSRSMT